MVTVELTARSNGAFVSCASEGHAGCGTAGNDLLCAAVSMLLRTTASALEETADMSVVATAPQRGAFAFSASGMTNTDVADSQLVFVYTLLRSGLRALEREYPGHICVKEIQE